MNKGMSDSDTGGSERHNLNSKPLVLGDGMGMIGGAMFVTDVRHLAVRNAVENHRGGEREPLAVGGRYLHTDSQQS